ncbi:hypothetical protein BSPWISOXPB_5841 [uncultured Gammaproteobacteria bacterium]|nr:hypothetical protein BSPWISOXPB_5841 [uncultured Gammaproteobacteria bacterium]
MIGFLKRNWFPFLWVVGSIYSFNGYGAYGWNLIGIQKYIVGSMELFVAIWMFWILNKKNSNQEDKKYKGNNKR